MAFRKRENRPSTLSVGIVLVLVLTCATALVGIMLAKPRLLAFCLFLIFISILVLQLKFYREGDIRNADKIERVMSPDVPRAPGGLRAPHLRAMWENMERTRILMQVKEKEFQEAQRNKEKSLLALPEEEDILFMTERSWLFFWPLGLLSSFFLILSTHPAHEAPAAISFLFLAVGLLGLLSLTAAKGRSRCYLTNFRILVRRRSILGKCRWSALNYQGILAYSWERKFGWGELVLKGEEETLTLEGLARPQLETVLEILRRQTNI